MPNQTQGQALFYYFNLINVLKEHLGRLLTALFQSECTPQEEVLSSGQGSGQMDLARSAILPPSGPLPLQCALPRQAHPAAPVLQQLPWLQCHQGQLLTSALQAESDDLERSAEIQRPVGWCPPNPWLLPLCALQLVLHCK